jgi:hypothetical protein
MSEEAPQYLALGSRLMFGAEELLSGDDAVVARFAAVLNAARPDEERIPATLRGLFHLVPEYSFSPGLRLLSDGTGLRLLSRRPP